jgi:REP element-mobilizing transposase RayT
MNDSQSLSHTKWNCKYHIVFAPKFHRMKTQTMHPVSLFFNKLLCSSLSKGEIPQIKRSL